MGVHLAYLSSLTLWATYASGLVKWPRVCKDAWYLNVERRAIEAPWVAELDGTGWPLIHVSRTHGAFVERQRRDGIWSQSLTTSWTVAISGTCYDIKGSF